MGKIAIYGGAFSPPTLAHKMIITSLLDQKYVDKIICVPDGYRSDKSYPIEETHRKRLISLFFDAIKSEGWNIEVDEYFLQGRNEGETTSVDVDKYFKEKLGEAPYHIFGADISPAIPSWKGNYDQYIEKKMLKIFIPRKGFILPSDIPFENYLIADIDIPRISSTLARQRLQEKKSVTDILTPEVSDYIEQHRLFSLDSA